MGVVDDDMLFRHCHISAATMYHYIMVDRRLLQLAVLKISPSISVYNSKRCELNKVIFYRHIEVVRNVTFTAFATSSSLVHPLFSAIHVRLCPVPR